MPGTPNIDYLESNLLTGATLNAAGTTNSTAVDIGAPGEVELVLTLSTVTGTTPTIRLVGIQADDTSFAVNPRTLPIIDIITGAASAQTGVVKSFKTRIDSRYVRFSVVLGGTSPVYTGSTLAFRGPHFNQSVNYPTAV